MTTLDFETERSDFRKLYREETELFRSSLLSFKGIVRALVSGRLDFPTPIVTSRIKDCEESITKFERKYRNELEEAETPYKIIDHVTDLLGLRIICYYESDVPKILEILKHNFDVVSITDKNEELAIDPNSFGYKGVHLDLQLNAVRRALPEFQSMKDLKFELQLRTIVQHSWSEIEHKISYKRSVPNSLRHRIIRLSGLFELADQEFEAIRKETAELIAEAQQEPTTKSTEEIASRPLNAFYCNAILEKLFDDYRSNPEYADIFVTEIKAINPAITVDEYLDIVFNNVDLILEYQEHINHKKSRLINPFTRVRHLLFVSDPKLYATILFPHVRKQFTDWFDHRK